MSTQAFPDSRSRQEPVSVPDSLRSPRSKLVYLYLATNGGSTVDELHDDLGMARISLLPTLDTLRDRGVVDREDGRYVPAS